MIDGLVPVPPSGPLREAALRLAPRPEQEEFSGRAEQTLPLAERDPARRPYVLVEDGAPVAFLVLDEAAGPSDDLLLRGFLVDAAAQGRGVATRAVAALPDVVRRDFPPARTVVLTVNVRNPVARAVYLRGGFVDGGELYLGGSAGPQHVLRLELGATGRAPAASEVVRAAVGEDGGVTSTHQVTNQPPPLVGHDVADDAALLEGVEREGAGWAVPSLHALGLRAGSAEAQLWAEQANRFEPELRTHDRYGHRVDEVEFHPAWHSLLDVAVSEGLAGAAWASDRPGAHVARAAGFYTWSQVEAGHGCPVSMTYAVVPALRHAPELAAVYEPLLTARAYDPGLREPTAKRGLLAGMGMTEKQGGSDVRAGTTVALPCSDGTWTLRGHKWFTSAPMCDLFLVLAQAPAGLSCFLVPRVLPDGTRNVFRIQRLKDKLGNRSNASSEPEFDGTVAWLVGEEGRGVRTILEMVAMTRLDCVIGSASGMRAAVRQAVHHCTHRSAFGRRLVDQPLMRNVLADLTLESEAAVAVMLRVAGAVDRGETAFARLAVPVAKYWVCKRQPTVVAEALECLGGNGYVEESGMPRLYREAPLNSIWEGSGNVQALDVLRVLGREPAAVEAFFDEVSLAGGPVAAAGDALLSSLSTIDEGGARRLVERMALLLQASLLVRHAPAAVADAFVASRLGDGGLALGTLPTGVDLKAVLARA